MGIPASLPGNKRIYKTGESAEYLYRVESGCIRTYSDLNDGRRYIHAFYFPGDLFGLEASDQHHVSAETVTPSSILLVKRKTLASRAAHNIDVVRFLLRVTAMELQRTQNHSLLLLNGAQKRIIGFLREMMRRKQGASEVDLPMPRRDMADYLGLTIESVSRAFTQLKNNSTISMLTSRRVFLRDPSPS